jgi:putative drug exporter of the RND superfamily
MIPWPRSELRSCHSRQGSNLSLLRARLTDTKDALMTNLKWAILWIVAATYIVLLLMMGTPLIPLKALILNLLSLSATYGALVWVFQEGHLAGLLAFTATGGIDAFTPILLICIAFGLSMDYEVFLLCRIKEEYDLSHDNDRAVVMGLSKSGNIVTAAAVPLALVFAAIGTSGVAVVKMLGVGMVIAVLTDAFLIRATLVPALMKLTGSANWWAPAWMRSWRLRWGIWEREPVRVGSSAAASDSVKGSRTS